MKFLTDYDGTDSINTKFVKRIYIDDDDPGRVCLIATFDYEGDYDDYKDPNTDEILYGEFILKKFDSNDRDKNLTAAKKYFVELIDKLNSGGKI